ncbi:hypothetical protein CGCA056_v015038 [Colletotrichum aenigma]|uniref:uncharacterized protein n=2 Tax=Colletotrichum aenigma TaxID=1215731 RepID=UPI00187264E2|nr:uncharacterized protein CGCA056_v015125 [Colletotrichum aenigma]XP_037171286.1 uncharacterized protein CGCA056_v015082 [Colletotrichum aenigma]XP_037171318.1 uncharacterized protein CGCA056_v015051 [Colletotrichum aenigma]XP_037171326.1 uncharacterized protein CGCA056_v015038 [Colletotrichum aenigma]KAF5483121.1 hypothetical protein CGCA056_v015125 [Colletotrichum aenigma]KAF5483163.1 hypothetical protein CGCA056_v015082 [Colletotrichum aenigma]KAF5486603.1 hypothetical protein CGCA056_v01
MSSPISQGWLARLFGLLVLFTLFQSIAAQDLGLQLDKHARDKEQHILYSSKLTFTRDTTTLFNNDQLYRLADLAYTQMQAKFNVDHIRAQDQPAMIAVMAVENNIFISSSQKGDGPSLYGYGPQHPKPRVVAALNRCQARLQSQKKVPVNQKHRTEAGCAEIFAVHQYHLDSDSSQQANNHPRSIRIVAYGKGGRTGVAGPQNPCGGGEVVNQEGRLTWGCKQFMADEGIVVPRKPGKKVDIKLPQPFPTFTHKQISIVPQASPRRARLEGQASRNQPAGMLRRTSAKPIDTIF